MNAFFKFFIQLCKNFHHNVDAQEEERTCLFFITFLHHTTSPFILFSLTSRVK